MSSHTPGTTNHPYPEFSDPRHADPPAYSSANPSHRRVRTYTAHALILFNVYGLPLSSGLWLEYYFTSVHPSTSLLAISAIFGAQLACLGSAVGLTVWLYHQWPKVWRLYMFAGALSVCGAHVGPLITKEFWVLVLCQGALTGLGLGFLGTVSMLVLSTHYKCDIAVASTQCDAAGFAGAVLYTVLTWVCLRAESVKLGYGATLVLFSFTVLPATFLARPCALDNSHAYRTPKPRINAKPRTKLTAFVTTVLPTLLVAPALLLPPLYLPLLLCGHPSQYKSDIGPYTLFVLFGTAILSSTLVPRLPPSRLLPTTLCITATILAGVAIVPIIWMPRLDVVVPCAAVYGAGLGCVLTLWVRMLTWYGYAAWKAGPGRCACVVSAVGGLCAGGGLVGAAAVMERWEKGVEIVLGAASGCLVLEGVVVGAVSFVGYCRIKKEGNSS
ncbi:hypothetical protein BU25DRAFT_104278 [Macroventuria anomochaeta]|uniref:Uncharacterized protein n=1 Tax=Macroventuria anomochaeta TaxID=301207 RepID=A0ACB6RZE3_9PLEO|nr:uncharacterized protein BU25DRAFT_104278 [Macroventuria anomochaeta]KAF2626257.1 hypothetical protein BU25DRAFT_104278 [Macroventuria anomochaeta]